ncbi:unnamed protein product [Microthlaspi erraticum]|uniref:Pentacotripeptide-repeat region of PRORP domain-containing protein n=1 Tax=Microthlaspi erraticum TaxID=1685480 RepID=A0A6D2KLB1_9BRAS|nr:unnamed protein product [Microthlaspi erraticum]
MKRALDISRHRLVSSSSSSSLQLIPRCDNSLKPILNPLYNLLPQTQNPNQIVDVICSTLKQRDFVLSNLRDEVKSLIPHLGDREISRVLLRFQSDASRALAFFTWVKFDLGKRPNVGNYCLLLHILAWSKKFPLAMQFLCELIELQSKEEEDVFSVLVSATDECNWDPVVFDILVKGYLKLGLVEDGFSAFRKVIDSGFRVSVVTCNHLLNGLLKLDLMEDCWQVYHAMSRVGIHPNTHTFNILTNVFCKDSNFHEVNDFLEKMEEEGFEPDLVTYNTLVSSYCRRGRLKEAFYLYKIMYRRSVVPDLVTYTSLIKGLCRDGRVREAHQTFHKMVDRGIAPDCISYNTLIYAYCKDGMMEQSKRLLHEMLGNSVVPDRFTCKVIVEGFVREGRLLAAVSFVVELRRLKVAIPFEVCEFLIESLCREGKPFAAKHLLERISEEEGHEVAKPETYNNLIESLSRCDAIEEALVLKEKLTSANQVLDVKTYQALICCLCRIGRYREAESMMKEMLDFEVKPDSLICGALVNGYCKGLDLAKAESLLSFFAMEFRILDIESYNLVVKAICEKGSGYKKVLEFQERMQRVGFVPNSLSCMYMIQSLNQ